MLLLESYEGVLINEIVAYLKNRTLTEYVKQEKIICKDIFRQVELLSQTLHLQKKSVTAQIITGFNLSSDILYTSAGLLVGASFLLFATTLIYTNGDEAIPSIKVLLDIKKSAGF